MTTIASWCRVGVLGLTLAWVGPGCDAINDLDNIDISVTSQVEIPGKTALDVVLTSFPSLGGFNSLDLSRSDAFQNSRYGPDDVDSVHLSRLSFTSVSPTGQDMSYLGTVVLSIETDGLPRIELARQEGFPDGAVTVDFATTDANLKNYLLASEGRITTEVTDSSKPDDDTILEIKAVFDVDIRIL